MSSDDKAMITTAALITEFFITVCLVTYMLRGCDMHISDNQLRAKTIQSIMKKGTQNAVDMVNVQERSADSR